MHVCRAECCVRVHAAYVFFFFFFNYFPFLHVGCSLRAKISQLVVFFFFFFCLFLGSGFCSELENEMMHLKGFILDLMHSIWMDAGFQARPSLCLSQL